MALNLAPRQVWAWLNDPATRKWTSITTLAAAAVILSFVLVWTWTGAVHPSAAKCSNAPARVTKIPQLIDILACIVAFLLGRITARPKIQSRRQLRDWTTGGANAHQLGQSRARAAVVTQAGLTSALFLFTFLFAFEAITLANNVWPITYYLRCANEAAPWRTLTAAFAFCFLAGRWLWLPRTPEEET